MGDVLTAEMVRSAAFTTTQFRGGYDEREVDDFLDRVIAALEDHERGAKPTLTSADVRAAMARKLQPERMVTVVVGGKP